MRINCSLKLAPDQVCALNARLAAAESMTHDVIRDLLGVKLDMTNYAVSFKISISNMLIFFITNVLLISEDLSWHIVEPD